MRTQIKRILIGLICATLLLSGCGNGSGWSGADTFMGGGKKDATGGGKKQENGNKNGGFGGSSAGAASTREVENKTVFAKGRYVEKEVPYGENTSIQTPMGMLPWKNGLYVVDQAGADVFVELEGKSFSDDADASKQAMLNNVGTSNLPEAYRNRVKRNEYMMDIAMADNGARMYSILQMRDALTGTSYVKYFLDPKGKESKWDAGGAIADGTGIFVNYGGDGYFYVLSMEDVQNASRKLFRVNAASGETKLLMDFGSEHVHRVISCGGRIFAISSERMYIYDAESMNELERDKVLEDLIADGLKVDNGNYATGFLLYPGKDDSVYVATDRGLYRHVMYGSVSELLIDGEISSLGDISKLFTAMYVDETGENGMPVFYFLYENKRLMRFAYDPDMATVPENIVTIYGLTESSDIRLAITSYQALHPECYMRYEIGLGGQDGTTRDDALSILATRIAAGEGPDILVLDDLPFGSYMEKGVLMDLDGFYGELKAEAQYFDNIIDASRREGKLYAIPMMFAVPMVSGDENVLKEIKDVESLLRVVENSTVSTAGYSSHTGLYNAYTVLTCMSCTNSKSWMNGDGSLNKDALAKFLTQCKRLYEADGARRKEGKLERGQSYWFDYDEKYSTAERFRYNNRLSDLLMDQLIFQDNFSFGLLSGNIYHNFNYCYSLAKEAKVRFQLMPGEGKVALPFNMLGINAATPVPELAKNFVRFALQDYQREAPTISGLPISRDVLLEMEKPSEHYMPLMLAMSLQGPDGRDIMLSFDVDWQEPAVYDELNAMLDSLDTVNCCEYELFSTVLEEGVPALTGEKTIEEAVNAITKKIQLYLSE